MRRTAIWVVVLPIIGLVALGLGWQPARAAGVVTNCSDDADFSAKLAGGGNVSFACGPATIVLASTKTITQNTTIDGGQVITLSGASARQLFVVNAGAALTLTNVTIRNGFSSINGGAILNNGSLSILGSRFYSNTAASGFSGGAIESFGVLNISNSEFAHNSAGNGGVLFPRETTSLTTISGSSFHDNQTTNTTNGWGGAMLVWNGAQLSVDSTSFINNTAQTGGALYVTSVSAVTISNGSNLSFNQATANGGAVYNAGTATLNHSTLSGNSASASGGAILNLASAALNNVALSGNTAYHFGGGIDNLGTLTLFGSVLSGNTVTQTGGAIYNAGTATLNDSLLNHNSASIGGALANNVSTLTLNRSTLADNAAGSAGGGIYSFGNTNLNSSTLSGNSASNGGGGFYNDHSVAALTNSTFSGNSTATLGGGFFNSGQAIFYNVTFANNRAASGGALYINLTSQAALTNTILAYSPAGGNCWGAITANKFSISDDLTCALAGSVNGANPNGLDPLLTALGNYGGPTPVHMLKNNSPAINGVSGSDAPSSDQRGVARPQLGGYDIGAVERQDSDSNLAPRLFLPAILR